MSDKNGRILMLKTSVIVHFHLMCSPLSVLFLSQILSLRNRIPSFKDEAKHTGMY